MRNNIGEARRSYAMTRDDGKFSQEDAASFFKVSLSTYQKWEQGTGKLNGEILSSIADKYDCSVEYLLCRTDNPRFEKATKRSKSPDLDLFPDELELLSLYRRMDDTDKSTFLNMAHTLALAGDVKKKDACGTASGDCTVVR